jgi:hypothetical protein
MPSTYASGIALSHECLLAACAETQAEPDGGAPGFPTDTWAWALVPTLASDEG